MRLIVPFLVAFVAAVAPAGVSAAEKVDPIDPESGSPSGFVYAIPLDSARRDAAPAGTGVGDEARAPIHSEDGFGSSAEVPGATAPADDPGEAGTAGKGQKGGAGGGAGGQGGSGPDVGLPLPGGGAGGAGGADGPTTVAASTSGSDSPLVPLGASALALALGLGLAGASRRSRRG